MSLGVPGLTGSPERRAAGTIAGVRQPLTWPSERPFRILSIDGGGIKGIFPASVLTAFERDLCGGRPIGDFFDLIAGTSTGGIIALGLSIGLPAGELKRLYIEHGAAIFPAPKGPFAPVVRAWRSIRKYGRYAYERDALETALTNVLSGRCLGDARRRLCVPSFEGTYGEVFVYKTPHHPDFKKDWEVPMLSVALATAAAPTFFKAYKNGNQVFADGGVWANNPVMIGLVDALSTQDLRRRQVEILSISCGDVDIPFTEKQMSAGGIWHWKEVIKSAMHLTRQNATGQAGLLIGRDNLVRIEPPEVEARLEMDDVASAVALLPTAGEETAARLAGEVRRFFSAPVPEAPAFYGPREKSAPPATFAI